MQMSHATVLIVDAASWCLFVVAFWAASVILLHVVRVGLAANSSSDV